MGYIQLVYGRNMVIVLYFSALFFGIGYMLQCIFVFSEAYWESRIVFSLSRMSDTDPDALLKDYCDTYLICLLRIFLGLPKVNSGSIFHFLCVELF